MTHDRDPSFYKSGYEGYERPEQFPTRAALQDYRRLLLEKTQAQIAFIERRLGSRRLRVIEFGSGNGRLLVALVLAGLLQHGVGVEISRSRSAFARAWATDLGLSTVTFVTGDALAFTAFDAASFDLAICITGAFNCFYPISEQAPQQVLRTMRLALAPGGTALLELYQLPERRRRMFALNDGRLRLWQPLPAEDRFAYYLDDLQYWADRQVLKHEKTFIGRDGTIDRGRVKVLKYYTIDEVSALLARAGYVTVSVRGDFTGAPTIRRQPQPRCSGRRAGRTVPALTLSERQPPT
jgi:SAM-dependent methyltransferase